MKKEKEGKRWKRANRALKVMSVDATETITTIFGVCLWKTFIAKVSVYCVFFMN